MGAPTERVRRFLAERGIEAEIVTYPETTRTAQDAADAIGTAVGQIVKSLIFEADGAPCLVLCPGDRRVDPQKVASLLGAAAIKRADAEAVKSWTGYAIGGVPPVAHARKMPVLIDRRLLAHPVVYAAAGTDKTIFPVEPGALARVAGARAGDVTVE
jgi:Cys-tRNA(Pro) deacylase